ncbi:hypothetical protein AURANDRAFT_52540 [Aureococcus anophagefferens]|uniref:Uncharacterized protein n=1 Tax=Aureococcus anophagefferens TaxID=44056 RepID=F0XZV7_AURAN|nr:hypothetical protein AURANDRAFT_52540 [Aureococcus anophagefferens]EGB11410.1 hypothetical protein AURANDRAFT_52540 [Aureococcus anophagefferens]|eukprot:XP_009033780.1 hypothetical protein AURANDRAFT_52540 [Aureococcus anophagefferens]
MVCQSCEDKIGTNACPLCRLPRAETDAEQLARLRRHVENEVPEAITFLGTAYSQGGHFGLVKSDKKAAKIYRRAVELGNVDAMSRLGEMTEYGSGVKLDKKKAERLYRAAADRGCAIAQSSLAFLGDAYCEGRYGLVKSDKKAAKIWKRAVELGNVEAMVRLGYSYETGSGVKLDKKKAERLYRAAADRGHAVAQFNLGIRLHSEEKHEEGFRYYALAADQGYTNAENNLGCCYERGKGTELDKKKAKRLYRAAADRGDAAAQYKLGFLLDAEQKHEEAFRYYTLSADQGYAFGEFNLGCCYGNGQGTEVDLGKARYWFERAAAKGYERAIESLAALDARV